MKGILADRAHGKTRCHPTARLDCFAEFEECVGISQIEKELEQSLACEHVLKLRVKYCGGCNPDIDRGAMVDRLLKIVADSGQEVVCCGNDPDVILLVNGCAHACLEEPDFRAAVGAMCISIQGAHVEREPVAEGRLHEVIRDLITRARPRRDLHGREPSQ